MQYDPRESINKSRELSTSLLQRSGRLADHANAAGTSNPGKTAVHDLLVNQRRSKTIRNDVSHNTYQVRTAVMKDRGVYEGGNNYYENKYASGSSKPTPPPFKVRGTDPRAKETLERRQNYIPDLKKRQ